MLIYAYIYIDSLPIAIIKQFTNPIPILLKPIIHHSLTTRSAPNALMLATINPILKKYNSNSLSVVNYRPISNLTTHSKILEWVIAKQLTTYQKSTETSDHLPRSHQTYHTNSTTPMILSSLFLICLRLRHASFCIDRPLSEVMARLFSGLNLILPTDYHLFASQNIHYLIVKSSIVSLRLDINVHPFADDLQIYLNCTDFTAYCPDGISNCISDLIIIKWLISNSLLNLTKSNTSSFIYPFALTPFKPHSCYFRYYRYTIFQTCSKSWCTIILCALDGLLVISNMHKSIHYHLHIV